MEPIKLWSSSDSQGSSDLQQTNTKQFMDTDLLSGDEWRENLEILSELNTEFHLKMKHPN